MSLSGAPTNLSYFHSMVAISEFFFYLKRSVTDGGFNKNIKTEWLNE